MYVNLGGIYNVYKVRKIFRIYESRHDDLSENKTTAQSTTYSCFSDYCDQFVSSSAVDRLINTCTRSNPIGRMERIYTAWWYVDLGGIFSIHCIRIIFRLYNENYALRQRGRFAGFSLYMSNTTKKEDGVLCYKDGPELPLLDFNTTCIGYARYIFYYNERLPGVVYPSGYATYSYTELCEVVVLGCANEGTYGVDCDLKCPENCQEKRCNVVNGTCLGCQLGWTGDFCDLKCPSEYFGLECKYQCSGHCRNGAICNHVTGQCNNGSHAGWTGRRCNETCEAGKYGPNCSSYCSGNCRNDDPCNRTNGHCDIGCIPGYMGNICNKVCFPGSFGHGCVNICSSNCLHNGTCSPFSGICRNGCAPGYYGPNCHKVCPDGTFGTNCSQTCSRNCIGVCSHVDGSCNCVPGYTGAPNCTNECSKGSYGINCQHRCSGHCLHNEICSRFDGSCSQGCKGLYVGLACDFLYDTSTSASTIGLSIVVVLLVILLTAVSVSFQRRHHCVTLKRTTRKTEQKIQQSVKVTRPSTTKDVISDYEDLDDSNINCSYEKINMSDTLRAYQNLEFTG